MAEVATDLTTNVGRVTVKAGTMQVHYMGTFDVPESLTVNEAEELIGKLRSAANSVRAHNRARLTRPFWK